MPKVLWRWANTYMDHYNRPRGRPTPDLVATGLVLGGSASRSSALDQGLSMGVPTPGAPHPGVIRLWTGTPST